MNASPPPRRARPSLAERAAASGLGTAARQAEQPVDRAADRAPGRRAAAGTARTAPSPTPKHCWVDDPRWPGRRPALLLQWSRAERGWWGLVVLVEDDGQAVTEWVSGTVLTPA